MDLSSGFDIPNPFGLRVGDFGDDMDGYRVALAFLSDLAGGSEHDGALEENGGSVALLRGWQSSDRFRRVYAKAKAAAAAEQEALEAESAPEAEPHDPTVQRSIPLMEMPVQRHSIFGGMPPSGVGA